MRHAMMEPTGGQAQSDRDSKKRVARHRPSGGRSGWSKPQRGGDDYILRF